MLLGLIWGGWKGEKTLSAKTEWTSGVHYDEIRSILASHGVAINTEQLTTTLTPEYLNTINVFFTAYVGKENTLSLCEQQALRVWVEEKGGILLLAGCYYTGYDSCTSYLETFGLEMRENYQTGSARNISCRNGLHEIVDGVNTIKIYRANVLLPSDSVDMTILCASDGGVTDAVMDFGNGKIFFSSYAMYTDTYILRDDNVKYFENLVGWTESVTCPSCFSGLPGACINICTPSPTTPGCADPCGGFDCCPKQQCDIDGHCLTDDSCLSGVCARGTCVTGCKSPSECCMEAKCDEGEHGCTDDFGCVTGHCEDGVCIQPRCRELVDCTEKMDLVILVDCSGSLTEYKEQVLNFILDDIVPAINYGLTGTRVALVTYDDSASVAFNLDTHSTEADLRDAVLAYECNGGTTNTGLGIQTAGQVSGGRDDVDDVLLLISDGYETVNPGSGTTEANKLKSSGWHIVAVGAGETIEEESLRNIADVDSFHDAGLFNFETDVSQKILETVCQTGGNKLLEARASIDTTTAVAGAAIFGFGIFVGIFVYKRNRVGYHNVPN